jgi:hypothetical protein
MVEPQMSETEAAVRVLAGSPERLTDYITDAEAVARAYVALRASLDPDSAEAVEAWAEALHRAIPHWAGSKPETVPHHDIHVEHAFSLLRARAEAERP